MQFRAQLIMVLLTTWGTVGVTGQTSTGVANGRDTDLETSQRSASNMASTYVPMDTWIYAAFDRLAALGYVQTGFVGLRPWTRMECARLTMEAEDRALDSGDKQVVALYHALATEFAQELRREDGAPNQDIEVESIYTRATAIGGRPLTDAFHFGKTLTNNFGRPYGQGTNVYGGAAVRAVAGPFAFYARGEFQHAAQTMPLSPTAQASIAKADFLPVAPADPASNTSRGELLDAYASVIFKNNQLSFGKQSLWWGPGYAGPLLFSDDAPPVTMLRYDRVGPFKLPWIFRILGPVRVQLFIGQLSGQQFVNVPDKNDPSRSHVLGMPGVSLHPQPYIDGEKISFRPTPSLEFSVSRTVVFGGPEFPVTLNSFWRTLVSTTNEGAFKDAGDRRAGFDFKYRIPYLRDWLTVYVDSFTEDQSFPLAATSASAWNPGVYIAKLPQAHRFDFRAEGVVTPPRYLFPGFFYTNYHYLSGYTNDKNLMGNWIGREGSGFQIWSTYWQSPRNMLQGFYRAMWADHSFLEGGAIRDIGMNTTVALPSGLSLQGSVQCESWSFPLLSTSRVTNVATSIQLSYIPVWRNH